MGLISLRFRLPECSIPHTGDRVLARLITCVALWCAGSVAAQPLEPVFREWVAQTNAAPAALYVLRHDGTLSAQVEIGLPVTAPAMVGSLSKTVTGICAMELVRSGDLRLSATLGDVLDLQGPARDVTLAQVLTHTGGIWPDSTQGGLFARALRLEGPEIIVARVSDRPLRAQGYRYNNENYLLLEAAIARILGAEDGVAACLGLPRLAPYDSISRHEQHGGLGLAGGLVISAGDLARLVHGLEVSPDWPLVEVDQSVSYGSGILIREVAGGAHLWHTGALCTIFGPNIGAMGLRLANGWSLAAIYDACVSGQDSLDLQQRLAVPLLGR